MKKDLRDYFTFTRNEQRGLIVLSLLIFIVFIVPHTISLFQKEKVYDNSKFEKQIEAFEKALESQENKKVEYFIFDPNTLGFQDFKKLGLSNRQANNIINYRKAGGYFNKPVDLSKIYSIPDSVFQLLKPYISIKQKANHTKKQPSNTKKTNTTDLVDSNQKEVSEDKKINKKLSFEKTIIEINTTDSIQLMTLHGIGPVYASRIIRYRQYLGGYSNVEQLLEVYGIKRETYQKIKPFISIDTLRIEKINLNNATFKEINRHPYISFNQTKSIMNYRNLVGEFNKVEEILSNHLLDSVNYKKVYPYLLVK